MTFIVACWSKQYGSNLVGHSQKNACICGDLNPGPQPWSIRYIPSRLLGYGLSLIAFLFYQQIQIFRYFIIQFTINHWKINSVILFSKWDPYTRFARRGINCKMTHLCPFKIVELIAICQKQALTITSAKGWNIFDHCARGPNKARNFLRKIVWKGTVDLSLVIKSFHVCSSKIATNNQMPCIAYKWKKTGLQPVSRTCGATPFGF